MFLVSQLAYIWVLRIFQFTIGFLRLICSRLVFIDGDLGFISSRVFASESGSFMLGEELQLTFACWVALFTLRFLTRTCGWMASRRPFIRRRSHSPLLYLSGAASALFTPPGTSSGEGCLGLVLGQVLPVWGCPPAAGSLSHPSQRLCP